MIYSYHIDRNYIKYKKKSAAGTIIKYNRLLCPELIPGIINIWLKMKLKKE